MTWMSNQITLFYVDIITYPYPNPDVGLTIIPISKRGPLMELSPLRKIADTERHFMGFYHHETDYHRYQKWLPRVVGGIVWRWFIPNPSFFKIRSIVLFSKTASNSLTPVDWFSPEEISSNEVGPITQWRKRLWLRERREICWTERL